MLAFGLLVIAGLVLAACQPTTVVETVIVYEEGTPVVVEVEVEPVAPTDTLVICIGQEPDTLYPWGGSMLAASQVQEAIYDGPIDNRSFGYQAVILEKLPNLADGDAVVEAATVIEGDAVVDDSGAPATLDAGELVLYEDCEDEICLNSEGEEVDQPAGCEPGEDNSCEVLEGATVVRPAGCNAADCAVTYEGGAFEMDQMVVTFSMVPGLMWSDGTPMTASDSVYSFNLCSDVDTPSGCPYVGDRTASYDALDDSTIVWTGVPGYMDSTYFVNFFTPLPEFIWGMYTTVELIDAEESSRAPLGWGSYILDEWVSGESITLHKNSNYWRADEGLPLFDNLVYRIVGENSNANIAAILSGECDIVDQTSHLDDQSELLLGLQNLGQVNATFVVGTMWEHADFGIRPFTYDDGYDMTPVDEGGDGDRADFFSDVRTRRAVAMCFDRQAVVDTVMFGQSIVLDTYLPPQHPVFNADATHYDFDVAAGSALLEEVGWTDEDGDGIREAHSVANVIDGTPLSFNYWTTSATQQMAATQIMAQTALECGIDVVLEYYETSEYFAESEDAPLAGRRFDLGQFAWLSGVEPSCYLWLSENIPGDTTKTIGEIPWLLEALGDSADPDNLAFVDWQIYNHTGYANPEFDVVCNAAMQSLPGQASYDENHLLAQEIFATDLPVVPLYLRLKLAATRVDMCNFIMDPTANSEMWNIEEFGYGALCE
jgi:peptide/nickel transport system substrate-binding protein